MAGPVAEATMNGKAKAGGLSKNQRRREKKKAQKKDGGNEAVTKNGSDANGMDISHAGENGGAVPDVEVEYVSAAFDQELEEDPALAEFKAVFEKFSTAEELCGTLPEVKEEPEAEQEAPDEKPGEDDDEEGEKGLSKRQRKKLTRLSVAELKQLVVRPDVVEAHDVTSTDPKLLVHIKAYRNTVPVPRHWCHKRKYLQGKRGIEKPPFELPEFIKATGISKQRDAIEEKMKLQTAKQKMRERVNPKMGRMDIDYAVFEDAFLRYQTKPKLTTHGDLYYEGKEFEVKMQDKKPGVLSEELKVALGMPEGYPPPWLINMQRFGPPPAYPNLRISGLNAPIPDGAQFGMHHGGWGKPPVDEYGRPLYGDVFGTMGQFDSGGLGMEEVNRKHWGELEFEEEEEEEEEEEGEEEGKDEDGTETPMTDTTGLSSVISGLDTPEGIDLRKRAGQETPEATGPKELYKVLQQQEVSGAQGLFGSDRRYVLNQDSRDVQIALNPDELAEQLNDPEGLKERYDKEMEARLTAKRMDDDDDDDDEPRQRKRKADKGAGGKSKKSKDQFKF